MVAADGWDYRSAPLLIKWGPWIWQGVCRAKHGNLPAKGRKIAKSVLSSRCLFCRHFLVIRLYSSLEPLWYVKFQTFSAIIIGIVQSRAYIFCFRPDGPIKLHFHSYLFSSFIPVLLRILPMSEATTTSILFRIAIASRLLMSLHLYCD